MNLCLLVCNDEYGVYPGGYSEGAHREEKEEAIAVFPATVIPCFNLLW